MFAFRLGSTDPRTSKAGDVGLLTMVCVVTLLRNSVGAVATSARCHGVLVFLLAAFLSCIWVPTLIRAHVFGSLQLKCVLTSPGI